MELETKFLTQFLCGIFLVLLSFYYWLNRRQDYFKNFGIPFIPSTPILGSFKEALLGRVGVYDHVVELYNRPEVKDEPFFGFFLFHKPGLMINDPELIKKVTIKDFNNFNSRYTSSDVHDPLGYYNLLSVKGPLWRILRVKLSPFFTSGKLKSMFYLLDKNSENMINFIKGKLDNTNKVELEMKELASLYTTDVIANCAYGIEANCFVNPHGDFRKCGQSMFDMSFWRGLELLAYFMLPQAMKLCRFQTFSDYSTKFIKSYIPKVMEMRESSGIKRNDLIDTLIELKNDGVKDEHGKPLTEDMLTAQAAAFYATGFETSSTTQSFALYEVARNPEIQEKLRNEIKEMLIRSEGEVTYDAVASISQLPYLHQIVQETLRIYPTIPFLDRQCENPEGYSMEPHSNFRIPYGMPIYIPFYAIQLDEKNFPEPRRFDPERFSPENIRKIKPFTHFPFGVGPKSCIGERFALLQVKTGIVKILKEFRLETTERTPKTIVLEKKAMLIQSEKGLFLNLIKDPLLSKRKD